MKIRFHGAARTVTGSMHLLEVNGKKLLLDCGLFQGSRKRAFERNRHFPFRPAEIHNVILSHAHIDHSGNLPRLTRKEDGFRGRVLCTPATQNLCEYMIRDSAFIQERDVEYVNRKRKKKKETPFEPLYTLEDAERCLGFFESIPYNHETEVAPGVTLRFTDAGHILGSAITHLDIQEDGRKIRFVFTGDVGRNESPIIRDPVPVENADFLISESTYGNRLHELKDDLKGRMAEVLRNTHARGGKILIPAFSVGRTQTVVMRLHELFNAGDLPPMPIYVDSPLSANVTSVFRAHPECYDKETMRFLQRSLDPFGFHRLTYIRDVAASKALNVNPTPCVIIASSGMMEAGRVIHHLKTIAPNERNTILLVGFMAAHTLGRRVAERVPTIRLFGEEYPLRAKVVSLSGFSSHADRDELLEFYGHLKEPPKHTFLVHGEESQSEAFAEALHGAGFPKVDVPSSGDVFEL